MANLLHLQAAPPHTACDAAELVSACLPRLNHHLLMQLKLSALEPHPMDSHWMSGPVTEFRSRRAQRTDADSQAEVFLAQYTFCDALLISTPAFGINCGSRLNIWIQRVRTALHAPESGGRTTETGATTKPAIVVISADGTGEEPPFEIQEMQLRANLGSIGVAVAEFIHLPTLPPDRGEVMQQQAASRLLGTLQTLITPDNTVA